MLLGSFQNVCLDYGGQPILDAVSLELLAGDRVGLIGENGSGKSSLLRLIAGHERPTDGTITLARNATVGYLPQEIGPEAGGKMLFEVVADSQPELARLSAQLRELQARLDDPRTAADARLMARTLDADGEVQSRFEALGGYDLEANVEAALRYFGFGPADFDRPLESLSGGERKFVHLARLLLQTPDLLLLDEPDNHLDLQAKAWLEAFIRDYPGAVLVISHDRYLLDRVARKILELQDGRLEVYHGNDTAYAAERERRLLRRHELYTV